MTPERWAIIEDLFARASDLPPTARAAFVAATAGDDVALRDEVMSLLAADGEAAASLEGLIAAGAGEALVRPALTAASPAFEGRRIGAYRLLRELGRGGMGAVYLATRDDDAYRTEVAIKVLHHGLETAAAIARFRDERQILATLEHPGIVRMLDGGSTDEGLPYLVMEHVRGVPITTWAADQRLSVRERASLFRKVCDAVGYAHGRLIVHRDLKPQNILMDARGEPKLLDFGIARLLDEASVREAQTRTGAQLLTPGYASPEQVRGEPVSTTADVYALGAVLYELMTGSLPHAAVTGLEALRAVLELEPPRPSSVAPAEHRKALAGDLDKIILMALHKDAGRRYGSVGQLSDDLGRHLDGQPVLARAPTFGYRAGKFVRRNRLLLAGLVFVVSALTVATIVSLGLAATAEREARLAQRHFDDVRQLANSLLFEIDDNIRDVPGTTAARELIVSRALGYLGGLADEGGADEGLARELALAYMKIGDIQGNGFDPNLGRPDDGLASYARARAILGPFAASSEPATEAALIRVDFGTGMLHWSSQAAEPAIARVRAALTALGAKAHDPGLDGRTIARGHLVLALAYRAQNDRAAAAAAIDQMLTFARAWAARDGSAEARYWVAIAHEEGAQQARALAGDPDLALRSQTLARDLLRALSAEVPTNAAYRRELFYSSFVAGALAGGGPNDGLWSPTTGDLAAAEVAYREAMALADQVAARDPNDVRARAEAAATRVAVGWVVLQRDSAAALTLLEPALAELAALPEDLRVANSAHDEWFARCATAVARARAGQREQALVELTGAKAFVARYFPDGVETLQCQVFEAEVQAALGQTDAAAALLDQLVAALMVKAMTGLGLHQAIGVSEVLVRLAALRPAEACPLLARAVDHWTRSGPPTPFGERRRQHIAAAHARCGVAPIP